MHVEFNGCALVESMNSFNGSFNVSSQSSSIFKWSLSLIVVMCQCALTIDVDALACPMLAPPFQRTKSLLTLCRVTGTAV